MSGGTEKSDTIFEQIQAATSGNKTIDVLQTLLDSLAAAVAFAADDMRHADRMIDSFPRDLKQTVRTNWEYVRELRGGSPRQETPRVH